MTRPVQAPKFAYESNRTVANNVRLVYEEFHPLQEDQGPSTRTYSVPTDLYRKNKFCVPCFSLAN